MKISHDDAWFDIRSRLQKTGLLVLGEIHGASVNPAIVAEFVRRLGVHTILIEVNIRYASLFAQLTQGGVLMAIQEIKKSDAWLFEAGVLSLQHVRMYAELREQGIAVVPVKVEDRDWNRAEEQTVAEVRRHMAVSSGGSTLLIMGNLHARKKCFVHTEDGRLQKYIPAGFLLRDQGVMVKVRYGRGRIYNFGAISVADTMALAILGEHEQLLKISKSPFFDFDYLVKETKALR